MREQPELFNTSLGMTPMGRCGEPSEVAAAAAFLALPASSHATGQFFQSTVATRSGEGGGA
jgi:galactitol 2-dehydrogenase (L-tagatose-forming)